jgi:SAM-dependent methyltransferase
VPTLEENRAVWDETWDWSGGGEEWSERFGGTAALWHGALLPRIHSYLPAATILEIAPGYGRWTAYLSEHCERLVGVDISARCVDHCRTRFAGDDRLTFELGDGRSLAAVRDASVDLAFSFDSLVHVEADVLDDYLGELARVLRPDGVGFIHHSNAGSYARATRLAKRVPSPLLDVLVVAGLLIDIRAWRAESVTVDSFARSCDRAGLALIAQEAITWEHGPYLLDGLSLFTPRGSRYERPPRRRNNRRFRTDARRFARLWAQPAA